MPMNRDTEHRVLKEVVDARRSNVKRLDRLNRDTQTPREWTVIITNLSSDLIGGEIVTITRFVPTLEYTLTGILCYLLVCDEEHVKVGDITRGGVVGKHDGLPVLQCCDPCHELNPMISSGGSSSGRGSEPELRAITTLTDKYCFQSSDDDSEGGFSLELSEKIANWFLAQVEAGEWDGTKFPVRLTHVTQDILLNPVAYTNPADCVKDGQECCNPVTPPPVYTGVCNCDDVPTNIEIPLQPLYLHMRNKTGTAVTDVDDVYPLGGPTPAFVPPSYNWAGTIFGPFGTFLSVLTRGCLHPILQSFWNSCTADGASFTVTPAGDWTDNGDGDFPSGLWKADAVQCASGKVFNTDEFGNVEEKIMTLEYTNCVGVIGSFPNSGSFEVWISSSPTLPP